MGAEAKPEEATLTGSPALYPPPLLPLTRTQPDAAPHERHTAKILMETGTFQPEDWEKGSASWTEGGIPGFISLLFQLALVTGGW